MSKKSAVTVTGKDKDDNDVTVVVKRPSPSQVTQGQMVASKAFNQALRRGDTLRAGLEKQMRSQNLWSDDQQKKLESLSKDIIAGERQLARGGRTKDGSKFTKIAAKKLAIDMRGWRNEQLVLLAETRNLDSYTVEGQADNAKFDFLMSSCVFNEDGKSHFKDVEEYNLLADNNEYINKASEELANMVFNYDPEHEKNRPENKFLVDYDFAREDGRLVDADKNLVNVDGKKINEEGYFINEDGETVDRNGDRIDEEGNPIEEFFSFDDDVVEVKTKTRKTKAKEKT